jgi:hypothetical protein
LLAMLVAFLVVLDRLPKVAMGNRSLFPPVANTNYFLGMSRVE